MPPNELSGRFRYEPVHDLRTGRFAGVEVVLRHPQDRVPEDVHDRGARRAAELDASTALSAVASARALDPAVPVQVDVAADTAVLARDRLASMLAGATVAPMLEIGPPVVVATPAEQLVPALADLRRRGFRIALDGVGRAFGPEMIAAVRPDVVKFEPDLTVGTADAGVTASVRAVLEVCRAVGVLVAATGVRDPQLLPGLYAGGVVLAQGPLLGGTRDLPEPDGATLPALLTLLHAAPRTPHRPSPVPRAPVPGAPSATGRNVVPPNADPPVRGLATPAIVLPEDALCETVRDAVREHPDASGVVLVDAAHHPVGYLDRSRFLLEMTGRFGHALWADKPAHKLADPPRLVDERAPLGRALELSLSGDPARSYDDLVVVTPEGTCRGVVAVAELWRRSIRPAGPARPRPGTGAACSA
ncbi:EAL domain-containing protein [Pseudonocardia phyllosphaerae]|uniref:EAL domain-containing protein n=1 Tax=Pseudonocardia phyllosphaerae TaxID=3390502 RepID=UPI00397E2B2B